MEEVHESLGCPQLFSYPKLCLKARAACCMVFEFSFGRLLATWSEGEEKLQILYYI